jgi:hypothetical protein
MSSGLFGFLVAAIAVIITVAVAVGIPSLAFVAVKFFKFKERELALELEYRHKLQEQVLALEQRMQRLEETPSNLADAPARQTLDPTID